MIRRYLDSSLVVRVRSNEDSTEMSGRLVFVDNSVDTTTGTIMLKARFDNANGDLWPGQFVTSTLVIYEQRNAVVIPVPAVVESEGGNYVYVVDGEGKAVTRPVVVGRSVGDDVVITEGLTAGETVVTDGQLRLVPGAQVQVRNLPRADSTRTDSTRRGT
jgi:multidrug efflux system membrane fusion protein